MSIGGIKIYHFPNFIPCIIYNQEYFYDFGNPNYSLKVLSETESRSRPISNIEI